MLPEQAVMAWIEDGAGAIARAHVDSASAQGACVRLPAMPRFVEGDHVAVRICFAVGTPTVPATARVAAIRVGDDGFLCDLLWTGTTLAELEAGSAHAA